MTQTALIARLRKVEEALEDAEDHLDFTGYGDSYERSCAREQKLPEQIEAALADLRELIKEAEEQGWQPIETAPDEQGVDVWVSSRENTGFGVRVTGVHRIGSKWWGIPPMYKEAPCYLSHWMPLPPPPALGEPK